MERIKIAVDTLGGDYGCEYMMLGISEALKEFDDIDIIVTGKEEDIKKYIKEYGIDESRLTIINATEEITCHDAPVEAIRKKKDSSLVLALNEVKNGNAKACISSGNSGAILAGGQFIVGRAKGVKRTPLAPLLPTKTTPSLLIDCGANVDAKPNLVKEEYESAHPRSKKE